LRVSGTGVVFAEKLRCNISANTTEIPSSPIIVDVWELDKSDIMILKHCKRTDLDRVICIPFSQAHALDHRSTGEWLAACIQTIRRSPVELTAALILLF
jgi:hypothetical protein